MSNQNSGGAADYTLDETSAQSSITSTSAASFDEAPFRIMDLPGELRNKIYRHCFDDLLVKEHQSVRSCVSLLQSSRRVRKEAAPIFYKEYIGNANGEDRACWVLNSDTLLAMLKTLLAISYLLKVYSPSTEIAVRCTLIDDSDMSQIAEEAEAQLNPAFFTIRHWWRGEWEYFLLIGPLGRVDWSFLSSLYQPWMEGSWVDARACDRMDEDYVYDD